MSKNKIENTTDTVRRNPMAALVTAMTGGIEAQEARGQSQLVHSDVLPTQGLDELVKLYGPLGLSRGAMVDGDPLFTHVSLPAGWSKRPTDHSMWSELVDDKGRKRARIFYKAAFYDRGAHVHPTSRYRVSRDYSNATPQHQIVFVVLDGETELYHTASVQDPTRGADGEYLADVPRDAWRERETTERDLLAECVAWLNRNRPGHDDPIKSWELA